MNIQLPRWSALLLAGAVWCLSCDAILATDMVMLSIRDCEDIPDQEEPRILAEPMVALRINHPVAFHVGGVAKSKFDRSEHEIGTKLVARVIREGDNSYVLHLKSSISHQQQLPNDPLTEVFVTNQSTLRTALEAGERKKIPISANRWYELLIEKSTDTLETPRP